MTTTPTRTVQCPDCGGVDAIDLSDGRWLCLNQECRCEWDPRELPMAPPARESEATFTASPSLARVLNASDADEVLRAPAEELAYLGGAHEPARGGPDWTGLFVRYERMGVNALVVEDKGGARLELQGEDGTTYKCMRSSCVIIGDTLDPMALDRPDHVPTDDDGAPIAATILATAGLTLTVALDAIDNAEDGGVGNPRIGWLPPPCNDVPEVEQGVAYACAFLITTWGLDTNEVRTLAANLLQGASMGAGEETRQ